MLISTIEIKISLMKNLIHINRKSYRIYHRKKTDVEDIPNVIWIRKKLITG